MVFNYHELAALAQKMDGDVAVNCGQRRRKGKRTVQTAACSAENAESAVQPGNFLSSLLQKKKKKERMSII